MAWPIIAAMAIQAGSSIAGGIMGSMSASAQKRAIRKAAARNYRSTMEYSRDMEKTLMTNMTDYERDATEYRNTMYQRTAANGGIRGDATNMSALNEISDYKFDIDEIDYDKQYKNTNKYYKVGWENGQPTFREREATEYDNEKFNASMDNKNSDALKAAIDNYTGRQPEWKTGGENTALGIMRESAQDLQKDLNRTYVQGMQQVYYQRKQAYNNFQDLKAEADLYGLQSTMSLWSGLLGAGSAVGQGMISMYGRSGSSGTGSNLQSAMNTTSPFTGYNYKYMGKGYQY